MAFNDIKFKGIMQLDNLHAQNRVLSYSDLITQDFRYKLLYDYTSAIEYSSIGYASNPSILNLDGFRTFVTVYSQIYSNRVAFIIDNDGNIVSSIYEFETIDSGAEVSISLIDDDKIVIVYPYGNDNLRCSVITTIDNSIVVYPSTKFSDTYISYVASDVIDSSNIIVSYSNKLQILTIDGNYVIENTSNEVEFNDSNSANFSKLKMLNLTKGITCYVDTVTGYGKNFIFEVNTLDKTIDVYSMFTFGELEDIFYPQIEFISETRIIISYLYYTAVVPEGAVYSTFCDISNTKIINYTPKQLYYSTSSFAVRNTITKVTDSIISIAYTTLSIGAPEVYLQAITIDEDNKDILIEESSMIALGGSFARTIRLDSCLVDGKVCIIYGDTVSAQCSCIFAYNFEYSINKLPLQQKWNKYYTTFLADFEDSLECGNITGSISGWRLKRKGSDISLYETIDDFDADQQTYTDYTPRNNIDYNYIVFSLDSDGNEALGIESINSVNFYGWILTDNTNTYKFDIGWDGINTDQVQSNKDIHVYDNYTQYPVVSFGVRNYRTGSITAIPYSYNATTCTYTIDESLRKEILDFLNDGNEKWLKNSAGDIIKVVTSGATYKYSDKIYSQPYEIKFDWIEVDVGEEGLNG